MDKMNLANARTISADIKSLLEDYCKKQGLKLDFKNTGSYTDDMLKLTNIHIYCVGDGTKDVITTDEQMYDMQRKFYKDLPPRGGQFKTSNNVFIVKFWKSRSHKFPIVAQQISNGKMFKFTPEQVINGYKLMQGAASK